MLRAALDDARAQMRNALTGGASGADVCAALSDVYDRAVSARWRTAIAGVDALLTQHFPLAAGAANPDELPNRVWIG